MIDWAKICSGCGDCCGPVPFEESFLLQNAHKYQEQPIEIEEMLTGLFIPVTATKDCVFLKKITKRCEIYAERPIVCRLQGTIPELPCPKAKFSAHISQEFYP